MVFQQYSLFPNMTVEQNMAFGLKIQRLSKAEIKDRITEALAMVGLQDKADAYPAQLSGGQQQRWHWPAPSSPGQKFCCWMSRWRH